MAQTNSEQLINSPNYLKELVVSMLKLKTFKGTYQATKYIEDLHLYKDVIRIDSSSDLIPIIKDLSRRLKKAFPEAWIGITTPQTEPNQDNYGFLVEELDNKDFEPHSFCILDIDFKSNEIAFKLKIEPEKLTQNSSTSFNEQDISEFLNNSREIMLEKLQTLAVVLQSLMTVQNVKEASTFLFIMICAIGSGALYAADYFVKLLYAMSDLVRALTPIAIAFIDMCSKVIGGFFLLIAMIWKDLIGGGSSRNYSQGPQAIQWGQQNGRSNGNYNNYNYNKRNY